METIIEHIVGRLVRSLAVEDTTRPRAQRFTAGAPLVVAVGNVEGFTVYYLRRSQDDDSFAVLWLCVGVVSSTGYLFGADRQRHPAIERDRDAAIMRLTFPTARPTYALGRIVKAVRDHAGTVFGATTDGDTVNADTVVETPSQASPGGEA